MGKTIGIIILVVAIMIALVYFGIVSLSLNI